MAKNTLERGSFMKVLALAVLTLATASLGEISRVCSDTPHAPPEFNPDWYYSEFQIPMDAQIISLYGGFDRPGYIPAHEDYIAQFYRPGEVITGLDVFQLFNYDMIDDPLYNREFNIENLNVFGAGMLRLSVPITHGVIWNEACVSIRLDEGFQTEPGPQAVPEPGSLALLAGGLILLGLIGKAAASPKGL
jgi:hypothetical protein